MILISTHLILQKIDLQDIDLSPLRTCVALGWTNLKANALHNIDLAPLSFCVNLKEIELTDNPLQSVDLSHLPTGVRVKYGDYVRIT